jgi:hypothetical protein
LIAQQMDGHPATMKLHSQHLWKIKEVAL